MIAGKSSHELYLTKRVLGYVNRLRTEMGLKPLKALRRGWPSDGESCAIARSLNTGRFEALVHQDWVEIQDHKKLEYMVFSTPKYVATWIQRFDEGYYLDLIRN